MVLVILRHAKAEQSESKRDSERLLTDRGRADARAAGTWLAAQGISPDAVLCSPAARTRGTWHEVAIGLASAATDTITSPSVTYDADLYNAGVQAALDLIRGVDAEATTVLMIGHNPTMSALSARLDDRRIRAAGGLRTSGIAVHQVSTPWADVATAELSSEHTARG